MADQNTTHRYAPNAFELNRLPVPRLGIVLGLVGSNGIGKSSALKVLTGKLKPNLGRFNAVTKPQHVEHIPNVVQGNVGQFLSERDTKQELAAELELIQVMDRNVGDLSGGELQRFAIATVALQNADIYMFDEPSSYLDVKQRLKVGQVVRSLLRPDSYVIVVEHDLTLLEYLSDFIFCIYGRPGVYGVVTLPFSVRDGINVFLSGFDRNDNLRFRDETFTLKIVETPQENVEEIEARARYKYPTMTRTQGNFRLKVVEGELTDSKIIVMLGENGKGKTTFIRMLAGLLNPDSVEGSDVEIPMSNVSYKPQKISPKVKCSQLMDKHIEKLSGGELQRVAITLCLGKASSNPYDYEPSAHLDAEMRIVASKVIRRFILDGKKTAFVAEHDFIMATYLADRVIVYEGKPSIDCVANPPQSLMTGMNLFLSHLDITFRRDPANFWNRINKQEATEHWEQSYYYLDD
ncbi:hypothetical protein SASPL_151114 [Salvia splendens]|uniref:ABC transporter domain-containing protein n=1 Tax=Salvia splendens TaxID=180675 RepID=A0A8X8Z3F6_SALSN|nr:hypothetical protein SASPL_151114 [Salvia splendens]